MIKTVSSVVAIGCCTKTLVFLLVMVEIHASLIESNLRVNGISFSYRRCFDKASGSRSRGVLRSGKCFGLSESYVSLILPNPM